MFNLFINLNRLNLLGCYQLLLSRRLDTVMDLNLSHLGIGLCLLCIDLLLNKVHFVHDLLGGSHL